MSLFTRKQQWRRVGRTPKRSIYDYLLNEGLADSYDSGVPIRSYSDSGVNLKTSEASGSMSGTGTLRSWNTTGQLDQENTKSKWEKKKVTFTNCVRVVLIASRAEYNGAGLSAVLWYGEQDYADFKASAFQEFHELTAQGKLNKKEVLNELYQPKPNDKDSHWSVIPLSPSSVAASHANSTDAVEIGVDFRLLNLNTQTAESIRRKPKGEYLQHKAAPNSAAISPLALLCT